jgi:hypothetical protein
MQITDEVTAEGKAKNADFELGNKPRIQSILYEYRWKKTFKLMKRIFLGKTRYYDQRFIPALDAFNYIYINTQTVAISMKLRFGVENKYAIG